MPESTEARHVCTQCAKPAVASPLYDKAGALLASKKVECDVCGRYVVSEEQEARCRTLLDDQRYLLQAITRAATRRGETLELLTETADRLLGTTRWPSLPEKEGMFLEYIESRAPRHGDAVPIRLEKDYPLFFAKGRAEMEFIVRGLVEAGLVKYVDRPEPFRYALTRPGYVELERRKASSPAPLAPTRDPEPVTGLLDRKAFDMDLPSLVDTALSGGTPLAAVQVDVDHFKKVNDNFGHPVGDKVLRGIAERLQIVVLGKGAAYRYGGEEMTLLLPNHSLGEALAVAERARSAVARTPIADVSVTISLGVAVLPEHAAEAVALVEAADKALYDAKKRGRDLVRYHDEPEPQRSGPREPERKAPESDGLSEEQLTEFRKQVLHGRRILCPLDGAPFDVQDTTAFGTVGREFHITCTDCGLTATLSAPGRR